MKIKIIIAFLFCSLSVNAQLLYEISGNGSNAKSYIFATNRLCNIQFLDTVPNLFKVFSSSKRTITEMSLFSDLLQNQLAKAAILPDSVGLRNFYTPDEYREIAEAISLTIGIPFSKLDRMHPGYLQELYRNALYQKWLGYDENRSSEQFFQSVSAQQDKDIIALDSPTETLFILFEREPLELQIKELLQLVRYPERELQRERAILKLYKTGDLREIANYLMMPSNESTVRYSDYQIYARRNLGWVKRLKPWLEEGNCFICLDANYLGGDDGLLAQLRKNGYKVKAYNSTRKAKKKVKIVDN